MASALVSSEPIKTSYFSSKRIPRSVSKGGENLGKCYTLNVNKMIRINFTYSAIINFILFFDNSFVLQNEKSLDKKKKKKE